MNDHFRGFTKMTGMVFESRPLLCYNDIERAVSIMEKITLRKQASDALIVKEVQFGEVKTQSFVDGKPGYIDRKDVKRLGYADVNEYIDALLQQGYEKQ